MSESGGAVRHPRRTVQPGATQPQPQRLGGPRAQERERHPQARWGQEWQRQRAALQRAAPCRPHQASQSRPTRPELAQPSVRPGLSARRVSLLRAAQGRLPTLRAAPTAPHPKAMVPPAGQLVRQRLRHAPVRARTPRGRRAQRKGAAARQRKKAAVQAAVSSAPAAPSKPAAAGLPARETWMAGAEARLSPRATPAAQAGAQRRAPPRRSSDARCGRSILSRCPPRTCVPLPPRTGQRRTIAVLHEHGRLLLGSRTTRLGRRARAQCRPTHQLVSSWRFVARGTDARYLLPLVSLPVHVLGVGHRPKFLLHVCALHMEQGRTGREV